MGPKRVRKQRRSTTPESVSSTSPTSPPPKKVKKSVSSDTQSQKASAKKDETPAPVSKAKGQKLVTPAVVSNLRRGQRAGGGVRKDDVRSGGVRFVGCLTPGEVVMQNRLTNLQRFNAVVSRANQPSLPLTGNVVITEENAGLYAVAYLTELVKPEIAAAPDVTEPSTAQAHIQTAEEKDATPQDVPAIATKEPTKSKAVRKTQAGLTQTDSNAVRAAQATILQKSQSAAVNLDFILRQPVIDGRKYAASVAKSGKTWVLYVRYTPPGQTKLAEVLKIRTDAADYKKEECEKIIERLARFCERWPFPISGRDMKFKANLLAVATYQLFPSKGFSLRAMRKKSKIFQLYVPLIDPDTGDINDKETRLSWDEFKKLIKPIPPLPQYVAASQDRNLGALDSQAKKNAVAFMKYVAWSFHGKILSQDAFDEAYANLQKEYTGSFGKHTGHTVVKHKKKAAAKDSEEPISKKIFNIRRYSRENRVVLTPSAYFSKTTNMAFMDIFIRSLSRARLAFVVDSLNTCLNGDPSDLLKAWKTGCLAADAMNDAIKQGNPAPSQCECESEAESGNTSHTCLACFRSVICSQMMLDEYGDAICPKCALRDTRTADRKNTDVAKAKMKHQLVNVINNEARYWISSVGKDNPTIRAACHSMASAGVEQFSSQIVNQTEIPDAYSDLNRSLLSTARIVGRPDPFKASVDAVFPYGSFENERRLHAPDNIVYTALWTNSMKHVFVPAVLAFVADFVASERTPDGVKRFLKTMDDIYRCQRVLPYLKRQRLNVPLRQSEHAKHKQMWKTAIPLKLSPGANSRLYRYTTNFSRSDRAEYVDKDRILAIILQIEVLFAVQLPRSAFDGCPWPGLAETMPSYWSWANCWALFAERQYREWALCNKDFEQVDTVETLFLEFVWQICDPAYEEFLGLPLVATQLHPLRFAVAKKVHGRQMRTGWQSVAPSSIAERDDSLNNILFEACISNFLKGNFLDADCVRIRTQEIGRISVPTQYFDRELREELLAQQSAADDSSFEVDDVEDIDDEDTESLIDETGGEDLDIDRINAESDDDDGEDQHAVDLPEAKEGAADDDVGLTELDDVDHMSAVTSIEDDIMRFARNSVLQSGLASQHGPGISYKELIQSAAGGIINERLSAFEEDPETDADDLMIHNVIRNRILQAKGIWAEPSEGADDGDDMLIDD